MKNKFIFILVTLFLISCRTSSSDETKPVETKLDYDLIEDRIIIWDDIFMQNGSDYLVYFYSETCGHCMNIKESILKYYLKGIESMYFVRNPNKDEYFAPSSFNLVGIDDSTDLKIHGVPGLIEIEDYVVLNYHFGEKQILNYLSVQNN